MTWNWEALEFWLTLTTIIFSTLGGFVTRAIRANSRRIKDLETAHADSMELQRAEAGKAIRGIEIQLEEKVERHDREIAALQAAQVTHEDLGRIYRRVEPMPSAIAKVEGEVKAMHGTLKTIVQHLIEK